MTDNLATLDVVVDGRTLTVHRVTTLSSMKAERLRQAAIANPHADEDAQVLLVIFYPTLASCTTVKEGLVFTGDEFLNLDPHEADKWYTACNTLNPGELPGPEMSDAEKAEDVEKKEP